MTTFWKRALAALFSSLRNLYSLYSMVFPNIEFEGRILVYIGYGCTSVYFNFEAACHLDGVSPSVFRCTSTPMKTGPIVTCVET